MPKERNTSCLNKPGPALASFNRQLRRRIIHHRRGRGTRRLASAGCNARRATACARCCRSVVGKGSCLPVAALTKSHAFLQIVSSRVVFANSTDAPCIRVYRFVGDSLSFMMYQSLWKLVGIRGEPGEQLSGSSTTLVCGRLTQTWIKILYVRNDQLSQTRNRTSCGDYCNPWVETYMQDPVPTLLVVNMGLHFHSELEFNEAMDTFGAWRHRIAFMRPLDQLVFRTSVPGHPGCSEKSIPYQRQAEFTLSATHDWNLVPVYNRYAMHVLASADPQATVLDVAPMTQLRPDGHRAPSDCLHYYLPGVPDWWNHLLLARFQEE